MKGAFLKDCSRASKKITLFLAEMEQPYDKTTKSWDATKVALGQ